MNILFTIREILSNGLLILSIKEQYYEEQLLRTEFNVRIDIELQYARYFK